MFNSLMANLSISNELVDRIKMTQMNDEVLQGFLTSLDQVEKGEDRVIQFKGCLSVTSNE